MVSNSHLRDAVIAQLQLISVERADPFREISEDDQAVLKLHHLSTELSAALMPVIALIEIGLRNCVNDCLEKAFGTPDWMTNPTKGFKWRPQETDKVKNAKRMAQRAAYGKLDNQAKRALDSLAFPNGLPANIRHENRSKARQKAIEVSAGKIISQLTLFYWKRLYSDDYDQTLWKIGLKNTFPNKRINRTDVSRCLEGIYVLRNRVAHHETLLPYRVKDVFGQVDFIAENLMARSPSASAPLNLLVKPYRDTAKNKFDEMETFTNSL